MVATGDGFLDDAAGRGSRGFGIYEALKTRVVFPSAAGPDGGRASRGRPILPASPTCARISRFRPLAERSGRSAVLTGMIGEGVRLMLAGMAVVSVLLTLLVLAVKGMSRLALAADLSGPAPDALAASGEGSGTELAAVVTAAVAAYRRDAR